MIHNLQVNADLQSHGIRFLQDTRGQQLIPFELLGNDDIVLIPAFWHHARNRKTELKENRHSNRAIKVQYQFVPCREKSMEPQRSDHKEKIHDRDPWSEPGHEETDPHYVFARGEGCARRGGTRPGPGPILAEYISRAAGAAQFETDFKGQCFPGFDPRRDLQRIGVVNQTTMLASDTRRSRIISARPWLHYGADLIQEHFADTRDTLCYATNDNQTAVAGMLNTPADLAIVGGLQLIQYLPPR